jgi:hypothetical protein
MVGVQDLLCRFHVEEVHTPLCLAVYTHSAAQARECT